MRKTLTLLMLWLGAALAACASTPSGYRQEGKLASSAPADRPILLKETNPEEAMASWRRKIAPYVAKAMATYPGAKQRYLAGLPAGETFFVTTILRDRDGRYEQVFILVDRISAGTVAGRIWSDIGVVQGYKRTNVLSFPESEVVDWLISKPDGSEEAI